MSATSFYPVLMAQDVTTTAKFYQQGLGFETTFETDWYVSLRLGSFELANLAHDHATVPERYRALPRGVIVHLEVEDVDTIYDRLTNELDLDPVLDLKNEDFGQRHFIVAAPDGVLLDVIQPIPPTAEFAEAYL